MGTVSIGFLNDVDWQTGVQAVTRIDAGEVHVYRIGISTNLQHIPRFAATLTPAETERGQKYHQLKDRQRFVVSRGALRYVLARYLSLRPADVSFAVGENKKPYLHNPGGITIPYNITHAGDYILLAVSNSPIGADVEYIDPNFPFDDILTEHFGEAEISFINRSNSAKRFYLLWTRKESLLKATAQGIGEHLKETPSLDGKHAMPATLSGADSEWEVSSFDLPGNHIGSVAGLSRVANLNFFDVVFG